MTDDTDDDTDTDTDTDTGTGTDTDTDTDADTDGWSDGTGEIDAAAERMDLETLRDEIREIDHDIVELIARRTYVADTIAQVKAERGLPTTDEQQEQRVMDRAGENATRYEVDDNLVKAIFRLLIELNKVHQRDSR
jgi:chorismate mutase